MPTPSMRIAHYPRADSIPKNNNLLKPTGKSLEAEGQRITILGRVLDKNCMPIKNAIVEIWQTDPFGRWYFPSRADLANPYPVFAGSGRASTTTNGRFSFFTLFPGPVGKAAPTIQLRVKAPRMGTFETVLFFEDDTRNTNDPVFNRLSAKKREAITLRMQPLDSQSGYAGLIDIVLSGKEKYVTY